MLGVTKRKKWEKKADLTVFLSICRWTGTLITAQRVIFISELSEGFCIIRPTWSVYEDGLLCLYFLDELLIPYLRGVGGRRTS